MGRNKLRLDGNVRNLESLGRKRLAKRGSATMRVRIR